MDDPVCAHVARVLVGIHGQRRLSRLRVLRPLLSTLRGHCDSEDSGAQTTRLGGVKRRNGNLKKCADNDGNASGTEPNMKMFSKCKWSMMPVAVVSRLLPALVFMLFSSALHAQSWTWKEQTVDPQPGRFISMAVDPDGNLHLLYSSDSEGFKYGFRGYGDAQWYTMPVQNGAGFTG